MSVVEVFVMVDCNGNAVAAIDASTLGDLYDDQIGEAAGVPRRVVKVTLEVNVPDVEDLGTVNVPDLEPAAVK